MTIWEILVIGVGLSMDAFAVAVCKGLSLKKITPKNAVTVALYFGIFQGVMPVIGYFLGSTFSRYVTKFDHWIAFGLLLIIGGKMIYDSVKGNESADDKLDVKTMLLLAVATSIDALAVGITFAFLEANIFVSASIICAVTFALSLLGVLIGKKFGEKLKNKAEIAGGVVLILIGVKILLEHLGVINF